MTRRLLVVITTMALGILGALLGTPGASATEAPGVRYTADPSGTANIHLIFNWTSAYHLDVRDAKRTPGQMLQTQWPKEQENQRFAFTKTSASTFRVGVFGNMCITVRDLTSSNPYLVTDTCGLPNQNFRWGLVSGSEVQIVEPTTGKCWYDDGYRNRIRLRPCGTALDGKTLWTVIFMGVHTWGTPLTPSAGGTVPPAPAQFPTTVTQACVGNEFVWKLTANVAVPAGSTWNVAVSRSSGIALRVLSSSTTYIANTTGGTTGVPLKALKTIPAGTTITLNPDNYLVPASGSANQLTFTGYLGLSSNAGFTTSSWPCH